MAIHFLVFAASLTLLLYAARKFTASAETIGLALGLSPFAAGVLIVSIGTSLPELISSIVAVLGGTSEIVAGNVLGANISNLMLVLAAAAIASPRGIRLGEQYLFIDLHFLVGSAFLLGLAMKDGVIGRGEGVFLLLAYLLYVAYLLSEGRTDSQVSLDSRTMVPETKRVRPADVVQVAISAGGIYLGARFTIGSLESIATGFGVPPAMLAVTLLSIGTTLPELATSAVAARQGKAAVAVGNILGSCVFNALGVAGTAAVTRSVEVPPALIALPLPVFLAGGLLFYLFTQDGRVSRWEGGLLALFYGFFAMKVGGIF